MNALACKLSEQENKRKLLQVIRRFLSAGVFLYLHIMFFRRLLYYSTFDVGWFAKVFRKALQVLFQVKCTRMTRDGEAWDCQLPCARICVLGVLDTLPVMQSKWQNAMPEVMLLLDGSLPPVFACGRIRLAMPLRACQQCPKFKSDGYLHCEVLLWNVQGKICH